MAGVIEYDLLACAFGGHVIRYRLPVPPCMERQFLACAVLGAHRLAWRDVARLAGA